MVKLTAEQGSVKKFDMSLWEWFKTFFTGQPHFTIWTELEDGSPAPQLLRWWVLPRNKFFNIYLHKTIRNDEDRALHCHPWKSVSFLLLGRLGEYQHKFPGDSSKVDELTKRELPKFIPVFREAEDAHRLFLPNGQPSWTVFITGRKTRKWGFHCKRGWINWEKFVQLNNPGMPKGCGED